jgi:hypothetical protein
MPGKPDLLEKCGWKFIMMREDIKGLNKSFILGVKCVPTNIDCWLLDGDCSEEIFCEHFT